MLSNTRRIRISVGQNGKDKDEHLGRMRMSVEWRGTGVSRTSAGLEHKWWGQDMWPWQMWSSLG